MPLELTWSASEMVLLELKVMGSALAKLPWLAALPEARANFQAVSGTASSVEYFGIDPTSSFLATSFSIDKSWNISANHSIGGQQHRCTLFTTLGMATVLKKLLR